MPLNNGSKQARPITAVEAAGMVQCGDWVDYGTSVNQPDVFDRALAARKEELRGVKIRNCLTMQSRAVLEADPTGEHFMCFNWHFSAYDRKKHDAGICHYMPDNLGEIPDYYRRFIPRADIAVLKVCRMDENGFFNYSVTNLWHGAIVETAKVVVVEVTDGLPYVFGEQNGVHVSDVDYIIEGDNAPVVVLPRGVASDTDHAVARLIAGEIEDGACVQIGIGTMPNVVCSLLLDSGVRNLGVHTEMLIDGLVDLYKAGRISGDGKQLHRGKISFSFALGSADLYETIARNPDFLCCTVEDTNLPQFIMQNDRVVAINNTTQMDLQGQAVSESDGHRQISGTGGQLQFVRGAYASKGGKSFICLSSVYEKHGQRKSRIVLDLTPGNIVTVPRTDMMYVVSEYGLVNLKGKSNAERARAMISIAHPDFREQLEREAYESKLIPRAFF